MKWSTFYLLIGITGLICLGTGAIHGYAITMICGGFGFIGSHWMIGEPYIDERHPKWGF